MPQGMAQEMLQTSPGDVFPHMMLNADVQGFVEDPTESERFRFTRNGDKYLCPFQV